MSDLLAVEDLSVELRDRAAPVQVLDSVGLSLAPAETVCLVGESGSGKTVTAMSVMRLIDYKGGRITHGAVRFGGRDLAALSQREMSVLRGRRIGLVSQEPMTAFDPLFTIGAQITEVLVRHRRISPSAAREHTIALLRRVKIADPDLRIDHYPHQLSGGMRQRAMIAMALACDPQILIADEPTTALDVTIQAQILRLLKDVQTETRMAMLLITHDLGVAASVADRVVVMYAGRVVEDAPVGQFFARPAHPYSRGLLRSIVDTLRPPKTRLPSIDGAVADLGAPPTGCRFHPRCPGATGHCRIATPPLVRYGAGLVACWHPQSGPVAAGEPTAGAALTRAPANRFETDPLVRVIDLHKHYPLLTIRSGGGRPVIRAVDGVTFDIAEGETLGIVGESGSGKSTMGRLLLRLEPPTAGRVEFDGRDLASLDAQALRESRRHMQMVFQDPYGSINPRWSIGDTIAEPLVVHERLDAARRRERVRALLDQVGLDPDWDRRHPHQLSGGQRQRVAIARAIALNPRLVIADEAVSALDVSVRPQVVNLLMDIKARLGLTYLFIGHELNLVRHVSDRVGVMFLGRLVEIGPAEVVFRRPAHPYARALIAAIPAPDPSRRETPIPLEGEILASATPDRGCWFQGRCAAASARCREEDPGLDVVEARHSVACHNPF